MRPHPHSRVSSLNSKEALTIPGVGLREAALEILGLISLTCEAAMKPFAEHFTDFFVIASIET